MATRVGTLTSETILQPGSNNFSVRVRAGVRFPFKLLIQTRMPVSGRNIGKRLVRILYMILDMYVVDPACDVSPCSLLSVNGDVVTSIDVSATLMMSETSP